MQIRGVEVFEPGISSAVFLWDSYMINVASGSVAGGACNVGKLASTMIFE